MKKIVLIFVFTIPFLSFYLNGYFFESKNNLSFPSKKILQSKPAIGLNLGNLAPEIAMQSVDEKILKLSSLKGQLVLIDFWASWCGPCRFENPAVVKAYDNFKDKKFKNGNSFTVFSVSLDANKSAWLMAIVKDKLQWPNHVCDLQGWNNKAAEMYGITSIPNNYLINGEGIIISKNLKGEQLFSVLQKLAIN